MFELISFVAGALSGLFVGIVLTVTRTGQIKEDNERLNAELHKLTDHDERGRFKGGK